MWYMRPDATRGTVHGRLVPLGTLLFDYASHARVVRCSSKERIHVCFFECMQWVIYFSVGICFTFVFRTVLCFGKMRDFFEFRHFIYYNVMHIWLPLILLVTAGSRLISPTFLAWPL